jgi:hypothetical protein
MTKKPRARTERRERERAPEKLAREAWFRLASALPS